MKRLAIAAIAATLSISACGTSGNASPVASPTSGSAGSPAASPSGGGTGELHIQQINAMTGQAASFGTRAVHGAQSVIKTVNDQGGIKDSCGNTYTIRDTVFDMAASREQAIAGLQQGNDDKSVLVTVGSTPSSGFLAMLPVAGQVKMPLISPGSVALVKEWNPYGFRVTVSSPIGGRAQMETLEAKFNVDKVAVIYDISADAQVTDAETVRDNAQAIGYEVAAYESFKVDDNDFRPQLTRIKSSGAKWLATFAATPEMAKIITQMSELGMLPGTQMFGASGILSDPQVWDLTDGLVNGAYTWTLKTNPASGDPEVKAFADAYRQQFDNEDPTVQSLYGVQAMEAVIDAVIRSCTVTDREKFRDALAATDISVLGSEIQFDSPRDNPNGENLRAGNSVQVVKVVGRDKLEVVE